MTRVELLYEKVMLRMDMTKETGEEELQEIIRCVIEEEGKKEFSKLTMIGALANYISTPNDKFQPMNANFGILPELEEKIKDKKLKYGKLADRALLNL